GDRERLIRVVGKDLRGFKVDETDREFWIVLGIGTRFDLGWYWRLTGGRVSHHASGEQLAISVGLRSRRVDPGDGVGGWDRGGFDLGAIGVERVACVRVWGGDNADIFLAHDRADRVVKAHCTFPCGAKMALGEGVWGRICKDDVMIERARPDDF